MILAMIDPSTSCRKALGDEDVTHKDEKRWICPNDYIVTLMPSESFADFTYSKF
jgi:hypothetical protein